VLVVWVGIANRQATQNLSTWRVRDGRLRTNIGNVATLDDAVAAFNQTKRINGKTIIRVRPVSAKEHRKAQVGLEPPPPA
jgi:hypothetical protein